MTLTKLEFSVYEGEGWDEIKSTINALIEAVEDLGTRISNIELNETVSEALKKHRES